MAQVTMEGMEYISLVNKVNKLEEEKNLMVNAFVLGKLEVSPEDTFNKVVYTAKAELDEDSSMDSFVRMREQDVAEQLEKNPLAVQILYDDGDVYFNAYGSNFTSYNWDDNRKSIGELSDKLKAMVDKLEAGERLVEVETVEEDEEDGE